MIKPLSIIYAQTSISRLLEDLQTGLQDGSESDPDAFMDTIIGIALPLSAVCAILILAFSSYKLMMSKGDPDKLRDAKDQISNAIIGFVFILVSAGILVLISNLLGLNFAG